MRNFTRHNQKKRKLHERFEACTHNNMAYDKRSLGLCRKTKKGAIDMKPPKCVECGETMIASYTRAGLAIWLCPHAKLSKLNVTNGAMYCKTEQKKEVITIVNQ